LKNKTYKKGWILSLKFQNDNSIVKIKFIIVLKSKGYILFISKFIGLSPNFNNASPNIEIKEKFNLNQILFYNYKHFKF
jgi:hypothetical protein